MIRAECYLRPPVRGRHWLWVASVALLLIAVWLGVETVKCFDLADEAERRSELLSAKQLTRPVPKKSKGALEEQRHWAELKRERQFSWSSLFVAVEQAGSEDIELLAVVPDKANSSVKLNGEARDQAALMVFLNALAEQSVLKNVHLTHQQTKKRERLESIVFEVKAAVGD